MGSKKLFSAGVEVTATYEKLRFIQIRIQQFQQLR
jgi:hypothetical protein